MRNEDFIVNDCPTDNNTIDCSECKLECKLRFETKNNSVEFLPETLQPIIYY